MAAPNTIDKNAKEELSIACCDGACTGFVEVCRTDTLSDVRSLVMDDFDDDMIPDDGDFYFAVNGIRLSIKQEARKSAWDLLETSGQVSIHSKRKKLKVEEERVTEESTEKCTAEKQDVVAVDYIVSARQRLNFDGEFPYDRYNREANPTSGESHKVSGQDDDAATNRSAGDKHLLDDDEQATEGKATVLHDSIVHEEAQSTAGSDDSSTKQADPTQKTGQSDSDAERNLTSVKVTCARPDASEAAPIDIDVMPISEPPRDFEQTTAFLKDCETPKDTSNAEVTAPRATNMVVIEAETEDSMKDDDDDEYEEIIVVDASNDPHQIHDQALKGSCDVLNEIKTILDDNPLFCSADRRKDWTDEISESLAKSAPNVVIGVLGNTGVGKSSLLNALLEEASVLPTSGSRGCTAAVVELKFNNDLKHATSTVPAYKGEVEFITLQEWAVELKLLIGECSTMEEKKIYARCPEEARQPDAAAAWSKIDQVYGRGTMERYTTYPSQVVYDRLINDNRVKSLLTPKQGSSKPYNSIVVQEGQVHPEQAKILLQGFGKISTRLRRTKKKWAQAFRSKINDYVYRRGNGNLPQTWPLIRKVVLEGPWVALNTGACLVDLPGVVSEHYLQNCNQIWVVAPIKRAVDDGTAKELLGEQFRRRLLMDGQYGNVSFICTQTDDREATEIMRDHQDVAVLKPGRWERMTCLRDEIMALERDVADLVQEEEDLKINHEEADLAAKDANEELAEATKESDDDDIDVGVDFLEELQTSADNKANAAYQALVLLKAWQEEHKQKMQRMQDDIRKLQRRLKSICATVRNEYSTACRQEDFRAGLKELCRKPDEEEAEGGQ